MIHSDSHTDGQIRLVNWRAKLANFFTSLNINEARQPTKIFYFNYICSQIKNVFSIGKNANNNIAPVLGQGVPAILTINIAHLTQQHVGEIGTYTPQPLLN